MIIWSYIFSNLTKIDFKVMFHPASVTWGIYIWLPDRLFKSEYFCAAGYTFSKRKVCLKKRCLMTLKVNYLKTQPLQG